jgi:hypothetical protein
MPMVRLVPCRRVPESVANDNDVALMSLERQRCGIDAVAGRRVRQGPGDGRGLW